MPHVFHGERTLMRVFIGESDRCASGPYQGKPLHDALLRLFRERGLAGATVLRGIKGFGASAHIHSLDVLRLSLDLPLVVEVVETEEAVQGVLPEMEQMIEGGMVTLETVRALVFQPEDAGGGARERHRTEGLAPDA
jgi:PII-like signaling protein